MKMVMELKKYARDNRKRAFVLRKIHKHFKEYLIGVIHEIKMVGSC